jgi:hypothetical protein
VAAKANPINALRRDEAKRVRTQRVKAAAHTLAKLERQYTAEPAPMAAAAAISIAPLIRNHMAAATIPHATPGTRELTRNPLNWSG